MTSDKIRKREYYEGFARGFNLAWDSVDTLILGRKPGKPLTWKAAKKADEEIKRKGAKARDT